MREIQYFFQTRADCKAYTFVKNILMKKNLAKINHKFRISSVI